MGLRINQNIAAMNAYRNLSVTDGQMAKSLEKLSSGFRINRAADDAAGLSISEGLRSQVGGLQVAVRNAQDGISVVQTAEGALSEVHSLLQRVRDLAVQSSNTGSSDANARAAAATEVTQALAEIDRISQATQFGGQKLLDGSVTAGFKFHVGSGSGTENQVTVTINSMSSSGLSLTGTAASQTSVDVLDSASFAVVAGTNDTLSLSTTVNGVTRSGSVTLSAKAYDLSTTAGRSNLVSDVQAGIDAKFGSGYVKARLDSSNKLVFETAQSGATATTIAVTGNFATASDFGTGAGGMAALVAGSGTGGVSTLITNGDTAAITRLDTAITTVSTQRANLGAYQNRLEHTIANLSVTAENLSASESRIRDTDMAHEMVSFTRSQILTQAGTAMLAQANQAPQQVLQLLRG
jgi:flagellin